MTRSMRAVVVGVLGITVAQVPGGPSNAQETPVAASVDDTRFQESVQLLSQKYCLRCHNADNMVSGIRVDQLTAMPEEIQLFLWKDIQKQVDEGAMPPSDEPQPTDDECGALSAWITLAMDEASASELSE